MFLQQFQLDFDLERPGKSIFLRERWPVIKSVLIDQLEAVAKKITTTRKRNIVDVVDDLALIKTLKTVEPGNKKILNSSFLDFLDFYIPCLFSNYPQ